MGLGNIYTPGRGGAPTGFQPFAAGPTPATIQLTASQMSIVNAVNLIAGAGSMAPVTVTVTEAQCRALNGTPVILVPGVAGKLIVPIMMSKRCTVSVAFSAGVNCAVRYTGTAISGTGFSLFANGIARYDGLQFQSVGFSNIATDLRGVGFEMYNTGANPTLGTFSVPMKITTWYALVDWAA